MDRIDVFGGTSTGSLIATGLALGFKPSFMLRVYQVFGAMIFGARRKDSKKAKYDPKMFTKALSFVFPKKPKFADLNKKIVIPVCSLTGSGGFWEPEVRHNFSEKWSECSLVDTLMQSCAAPMYFPSHGKAVDGGVFALNPASVALTTAMREYRLSADAFSVLSVGTGKSPSSISRDIDWGKDRWMSPEPGLGDWPFYTLLTEMASFTTNDILSAVLGDRFFRLDGLLSEHYPMDDPTKIKAAIRDAEKLKESELWIHAKQYVRDRFLLSV